VGNSDGTVFKLSSIRYPCLSTSPITGTIPADSFQPLDVPFDALSGLPYGLCTAYLRIDSTDPEEPTQFMPVTIQIAEDFIYLPQVAKPP
jgi:hypothetical protein